MIVSQNDVKRCLLDILIIDNYQCTKKCM